MSIYPLKPDIGSIVSKVREVFKGKRWKKDKKDKEYEQTIEELGFTEYCGSGVSRRVYAHNKCDIVIKIEPHGQQWGSRWLQQNVNEVHNWKTMPKELKKYFAEIYAHDRGCHWVIQEKAKIEKESKEDNWCDLAEELEEKLNKNGLHDLSVDICSVNIGIVDGRPVVVDYGFYDISNQLKTKSKKVE
jgi:hypothetical protein